MRLVMLDAMNFDLPTIVPERLSNRILDGREGALRTKPARGTDRHSQPVPCLSKKARPRIARDGHRPNVMRLRTQGTGDVAQRIRRKTSAMLYSVETFFFRRGNELAICDERRAGVTMVGIYSNNRVHSVNQAILTSGEVAI